MCGTRASTTLLFGTDATISAEGSIWDHLRLARKIGGISDSDLFASVSSIPARYWGIGDYAIRFHCCEGARGIDGGLWIRSFRSRPPIFSLSCDKACGIGGRTACASVPESFRGIAHRALMEAKRAAINMDGAMAAIARVPRLEIHSLLGRFVGSRMTGFYR